MRLPDGVLSMSDRGPAWADWVDALPALVRDLYAEWELRPDGWMMHGYCALVVPVVTAGGKRAMLKVSFPEVETEHEHLALSHWAGRGAVPLLRADPRRRAMLLEALRDVSLGEAWDVEACTAVAELYGLLHIPAFNQLRLLTDVVARSADAMTSLPRSAPLPRRLVEQAVSLCRDFATDPATTGTLIHTDLHYENVLLDEAGDWLAIDPKPVNGDPHYEIAPMLWNRYAELAAPSRPESVRDGIRRRFHTLVDAAGFDEQRARDWVIVRMLNLAAEQIFDPPPERGMSDDQWLTLCVTIAKAVQD
ncbi:aminoglycoside phosphotransferase family protein [Nocardioides pocheonensis]|uniref:Aminoglycoside resistance protein n=1 Tax=Nocardioides pocheonensis TaxID=661485 RepID=A0A3N0GN19_9ACTN|nr:aminoglycoside phosphotransferase family protein [Nocardioides pocheonensis]RNM13854.1 aminoglycoside resistance protein [Nocardioides pocheonensis]